MNMIADFLLRVVMAPANALIIIAGSSVCNDLRRRLFKLKDAKSYGGLSGGIDDDIKDTVSAILKTQEKMDKAFYRLPFVKAPK